MLEYGRYPVWVRQSKVISIKKDEKDLYVPQSRFFRRTQNKYHRPTRAAGVKERQI